MWQNRSIIYLKHMFEAQRLLNEGYTKQAAARKLGICAATLYNWIQRRQVLPVEKRT